VNPDHLEAVTHRENTLRGVAPSAQHYRQTHCFRGHPFAGKNLYVNPRGARYCRTCNRIRDKQRRSSGSVSKSASTATGTVSPPPPPQP
jgi:hypothetical protein